MTQNFARAALSAALCSSLLMVPALAAAGPIEDGVKLLEAQRYAEATKLFQKEAAKDNPRAMYYLGDMLNQGLGTHRQPLSATAWWEKGAYLGDVDCQLALASAYRAGLGVKLDPRQALIWTVWPPSTAVRKPCATLEIILLRATARRLTSRKRLNGTGAEPTEASPVLSVHWLSF